MKNRKITLLPDAVDNNYNGMTIAKWIFYLLTIVTIARSLIHLAAPDGGAGTIATIPLDTYTEGGAAAVISIFSLWGLSQLLMGIFYVIVSFKYKSLIPLMYGFLIVEYLGRIIIFNIKPIETIGQAPGDIGNYIFVPLCTLMLILSLIQGKKNG